MKKNIILILIISIINTVFLTQHATNAWLGQVVNNSDYLVRIQNANNQGSEFTDVKSTIPGKDGAQQSSRVQLGCQPYWIKPHSTLNADHFIVTEEKYNKDIYIWVGDSQPQHIYLKNIDESEGKWPRSFEVKGDRINTSGATSMTYTGACGDSGAYRCDQPKSVWLRATINQDGTVTVENYKEKRD